MPSAWTRPWRRARRWKSVCAVVHLRAASSATSRHRAGLGSRRPWPSPPPRVHRRAGSPCSRWCAGGVHRCAPPPGGSGTLYVQRRDRRGAIDLLHRVTVSTSARPPPGEAAEGFTGDGCLDRVSRKKPAVRLDDGRADHGPRWRPSRSTRTALPWISCDEGRRRRRGRKTASTLARRRRAASRPRPQLPKRHWLRSLPCMEHRRDLLGALEPRDDLDALRLEVRLERRRRSYQEGSPSHGPRSRRTRERRAVRSPQSDAQRAHRAGVIFRLRARRSPSRSRSGPRCRGSPRATSRRSRWRRSLAARLGGRPSEKRLVRPVILVPKTESSSSTARVLDHLVAEDAGRADDACVIVQAVLRP